MPDRPRLGPPSRIWLLGPSKYATCLVVSTTPLGSTPDGKRPRRKGRWAVGPAKAPGEPYAAERRGAAIHPAVQKLKAWRVRNGLSQANAVAVLQAHYFHLSPAALRAWEEGRRAPAAHTAQILERFLEDHPTVKAP
jgi:DNA-binding transcriptional regulator YiaG